jgi:predicted dehydrogenase
MTTAAPSILVVGTGFGWTVVAPSLRVAGFDVVGLVGQNAERTAERARASGVARWFTDLDEAIVKTRAVAVAIATPPHTHSALTLQALGRKCHVLCEKPFAVNGVEARAMLRAAQRAGVVHMVGHEFRWSPERALIPRLIVDGAIGKPKFLTLIQYAPLAAGAVARLPAWSFDREQGGGWLGASGSHMIDQVRTWLGEFASLSAALPIVSDRENVAEDSYVVRFRLSNGVEGVLQQTGGAWGEPASMARVAGTAGTLWTQSDEVWIADRDGQRRVPVPADLQLPPRPTSTHQDEYHRFAHLQIPPYVRLCEAFRAAIEGRPQTGRVPAPNFVDGVACMSVLDAIRESAAKGGALVTWR